ncbi:MAG: UvrD-helicase domain-containing protein [Candidatus Scalindua sp.]|nr:UvrD-helicase domain-containing protein [Candidatus Scalindua sp.]
MRQKKILNFLNILKMLLNKNKVIIACAGSGKTTSIVRDALKIKDQRVLVTTYTNENLDQIKAIFIEEAGCIPSNITVQSWFSFLLQEGIRPYQNYITDKKRVQSILFQAKHSRYHRKDNYLTKSNFIYSNKVSEFVYECDRKTEGLVTNRLEKIYDYIFIDELQDFAGYDLNLLEIYFNSRINVIIVGDPRQATYSTNNAQKNRQHRRSNIYSWVKGKEDELTTQEINDCYRCNQRICDFANKLFPDLPQAVSKNKSITGHDGIFCIHNCEVRSYIDTYNPTILKYNKRADTLGFYALNIGLAKGRTFNRVLIFPTQPMLNYLKTDDLSKVGDKHKLYVAVTRAKYSATFVKGE